MKMKNNQMTGIRLVQSSSIYLTTIIDNHGGIRILRAVNLL